MNIFSKRFESYYLCKIYKPAVIYHHVYQCYCVTGVASPRGRFCDSAWLFLFCYSFLLCDWSSACLNVQEDVGCIFFSSSSLNGLSLSLPLLVVRPRGFHRSRLVCYARKLFMVVVVFFDYPLAIE